MHFGLLAAALIGGALAAAHIPAFDFQSFAVGIATIRFADLLQERLL